MNIDNLTIAEARQTAAMFATTPPQQTQQIPQTPTITHGLAIVVLDRGFVYVGHCVTDAQWCHITDARNIRYWGTERGLGQLVREGPTSKTRLDDVGTVNAPMRAVISVIPVVVQAWTNEFSR